METSVAIAGLFVVPKVDGFKASSGSSMLHWILQKTNIPAMSLELDSGYQNVLNVLGGWF